MSALWIILGLIGAACILLILNHDTGVVMGMESNSFANLVWFGIWGTVVGAAILPRAGQWRAAARNLMIWLVVTVMLMTAYVYRYELQDVASMLTAGIVPGSPISAVSADGRPTTLLIRTGNGHFSARGEVNGAPVPFVVDTGANVVVLTQEDAGSAGIETGNLVYSVPVITANGRTTAARIRIDGIRIGDIEREGVDALVARPGALETSLLGMSFLSTLHSFEFRGDRLLLTD